MPRAEGALGLGVFLLGQGEKKIDFWASQLWLRGGRWSSDVGSLCPVLGCLELGEGLEVRGGGLGVRTPEKTSSCGGEEDPSFSLSNSSIEPIDGIRLCFIRGLGCQGQFWTNWRSAWLHVRRSSSLFTKCPTFLSKLSFTSPHPKLSRGCAFPWALPLASRPLLEMLVSAKMRSVWPRNFATSTAELPTLFCPSIWRPSLLKALTRNSTTGEWPATAAYISAEFPQVCIVSDQDLHGIQVAFLTGVTGRGAPVAVPPVDSGPSLEQELYKLTPSLTVGQQDGPPWEGSLRPLLWSPRFPHPARPERTWRGGLYPWRILVPVRPLDLPWALSMIVKWVKNLPERSQISIIWSRFGSLSQTNTAKTNPSPVI